MKTYELKPHSAHPPARVSGIEARIIGQDENWLRVRWRVEQTQALHVPPFAGRGRADELWRTTCFELFLMPADGGYCEFNFSPSERWAAYDFSAYRDGMTERAMPQEPVCALRLGSSFAIFDAAIPAGGLPRTDCAMNLAAVIEEEGHRISYWAMAHARDVPDFHDPACFAGHLAAPAST